MAIKVTADMFAGNFIKELPSRRLPAKGRPNGALRRFVMLRCFNCGSSFERDLHVARRIQQKCCSHRCYNQWVEVYEGGNERHPLYSRWLSMVQRTRNKNCNNYSNYGGRGISIQDDLDNFVSYVTYVTSLEGYDEALLSELQLDRKDNNKDYAKGNLRWASRHTQIANQRPNSRGRNKYTGVCWSKTHKRWVARVNYAGKTYCSSTHETEESALDARNQCIMANNLPHPIQQYTS